MLARAPRCSSGFESRALRGRSWLPLGRPLLCLPLQGPLRLLLWVHLRLLLGDFRRVPRGDSRCLLCGNFPYLLLRDFPRLGFRDFFASP